MRDRAFLTGAVGFSLGILAGAFYALPLPALAFVGLLGSLFVFAFAAARRRSYLYIGICVITIALGAARTEVAPGVLPDAFRPLLNKEVTFEGVVSADPDLRETTQRITLEITHEGIETKVLAVADLYPVVRYGETVRVTGKFVRPEPFDTDGGRTFRYDQFLAKDGVFALVERASLEVIAPRTTFIAQIRGTLSDIKTGFLSSLAIALPEPHAALAGGLVAGGKQGLGEGLLDAFIISGLVHIVVLSGYNVMIVAEGVLRALSIFPRRIAASFAAITIGAFVLAAGAGAASIRAGLMAGVALFARATYRTYDALRALIAAGILMLLWNPLLLAFDPGFQLSFVATVGLILGAPLIENRLMFIKNEFIRDIAAATIAAQIAVLPLLLYQNGLFSVVAVPANLLVLPVVPFAMAASALAGLVGAILPSIAPAVGLPAYALLSYIIAVVENTATLPLAAFQIPAFPFVLTLIAYAGLAYLIWKHRDEIPTPPSASVSLLRSS